MSGKDEKPEKDVPICPKCQRRPNFWILYPDKGGTGINGWFWLFADNHLERRGEYTKLVSRRSLEGEYSKLENVIRIMCSSGDPGYHTFLPEDLVFQKVLQCAERFNDER